MGTCSHCKKRREVFGIQRKGGGSYRRGPRLYSSSICADCATTCLSHASFHAGASNNGYGAKSLLRIVERIDTDEARAAVDRYETGVAARKAADVERQVRIAADAADQGRVQAATRAAQASARLERTSEPPRFALPPDTHPSA